MNSTFSILLENELRSAAAEHLSNVRYCNNPPAFTKKGKEEYKEKYTPLKEESQKELVKLLKLNFPEFVGRFVNVYNKQHGSHSVSYYVEVARLGFEDEAVA